MSIAPLTDAYRTLAVKLSKTAEGASVAILDYRLAHQHVFPAPLDDVYDGWETLLSLGYSPSDIIVFGDSAGGNLALSLGLRLRDEGREMPAGIIAVSPWADLAGEGDSYTYTFLRLIFQRKSAMLQRAFPLKTKKKRKKVYNLYNDPTLAYPPERMLKVSARRPTRTARFSRREKY
jgi:acetyl esterase/lipase